MYLISVTLAVLKLLKSSVVKLVHSSNILPMYFTLAVFNPLTSILVSLEQTANIAYISSTLLVFRFSKP
jgi:hypothetical protein